MPVRTLALAPGRRGGLDHVVPVLAPSRRSWSLRGVLRQEAAWAQVVLLVGDAASLRDAAPLAGGMRPVVVDDGTGPRAVSAGPVVTVAERAAARDQLGIGDRLAWLLVHDAADRESARAVPIELTHAVRLDLDDPDLAEAAVAAADVAVAPVASRSVPLDLLAAAARGVPVVAVDSPAVRPYVDATTGACVLDGRVGLAAAVQAVAVDESRRVAAGLAAAERVRRLADPGVWSQAWLDRCIAAVP